MNKKASVALQAADCDSIIHSTPSSLESYMQVHPKSMIQNTNLHKEKCDCVMQNFDNV